MKKLSLLFIAVVFMIACKNDSKDSSESEQVVATKKPVVYVSNFPLHYFAERIGGNQIDLRFPMKNAGSITNWKPETETITKMQEADFVFINGASFEKWLMSISLPESILINTTRDLESSLLESGNVFTHSHGEDGAHEHNEIASLTWLDLELANKQAEVIANHLMVKFPEHKVEFQTNFEKLSEDLLGLDLNFKELTHTNPSLAVVFSHPVYQYFEKAYDLKGRDLHWEPTYELNHDRKHDIEHLKKDEDFKFLIWEAKPLTETQTKLEEMGIYSIVINPVYSVPENSNYFKEMQSNYNQLSKIFNALNE
ncbi:metal ABC transporter substrate-binding protein [Xanthomarina sp. GH4-25]|uniref:metal ABC transporter substrate-binding protein n=1 Tax=Xanthomarina sp. GH4-25 TaxID=3349335 RepID=UPI003877F5BB